MKTRVYITVLAVWTCILPGTLKAQTADNTAVKRNKIAIGLRSGDMSALTIKSYQGGSAIEGQLGIWNHGYSVTLLYEKYEPAFKGNGFNWYYGIGAHVAVYNNHYWVKEPYDRYRHYYNDEIGVGVDGVLGIEYTIPQIPFAISLDLIPYVESVSNGDVWVSMNPGLGIKFTF